MNGGEKKIYDEVVKVQIRQEERHRENKEILSFIFKKLDKLNDLNCKVHMERTNWHDRWLILLGGGLLSVIGIIGKIHKWW